ncbi:MAG: prolyl oligopeptidase family serine peptidase [Anaerohalosphaeraceae bacterium]|nr:prolyl oligopeptidase family serine peptidase [Anaerohalosphaeraceae bacterium]
MNTKMFLATASIVIIFGMFIGGAEAEASYLADFETPTFSAGNVNGQDGWVVDSGAGIISTSYVISDSQSLNVYDSGADGIVHKDFTAKTDFVTVEFKAKISTQDKRGRFKIRNSNNGTQEVIYCGFGSNDFFANDGNGSGGTTTHEGLSDWTKDVVYDIKIVADIANNTYNFYVDDNLLAENFGFMWNQSQLDRLRYEVPDGSVTLAVDDLTIDSNGTIPDDNNVTSIITYQSSVSSDGGGSLDLKAEVNYDDSRTDAPIVIVMHGYSPTTGNFDNVRPNAQRLRDAGFFAVSVAMRYREGSDGVRDSGGVEIYDIYDAAEYVKTAFASYVDPNNVHITGYSGGGGNTMACLTKFPDYFRAAGAYFGMSDYGHNTTDGWYFNGAGSSHRAQLRTDIGDPTPPSTNVIKDRYYARASNLASHNNPYSEIHLFVNNSETCCPKINDTSYRDNAIANEAFPGEFNDITVHIGYSGTYEDFNGNGQNDPNEEQYWPHTASPSANQQHAAETWYLARVLDGSITQPVLNSSDELHIAGYVKTKPFSVWLGDGQNAAATLTYSLSAGLKKFELDIQTNDQTVTGTVKVDTQDTAQCFIIVKVNSINVDDFVGGGIYTYSGLADGDVLELCLAGDINEDCSVDMNDIAILFFHWLDDDCDCPNWCEGSDLDQSTDVEFVDFATLCWNWLENR